MNAQQKRPIHSKLADASVHLLQLQIREAHECIEEARDILRAVPDSSVATYSTPAFEPATAKPVEACLMQLMRCTADGDLISKEERTWLVEAGLAARGHGFNMITPKGVMYLLELGLIHA